MIDFEEGRNVRKMPVSRAIGSMFAKHENC